MASYYIGSDLNRTYYISHHGVLGQKWGVRRFQNKDGSLTAAGRLHSREKNIGTGTASIGKGRKIDTQGPVGGTSVLTRPDRYIPKHERAEGDWRRAEKRVSSSPLIRSKYSKLADWWGKDERDRLKIAVDFLKTGDASQAALGLYAQTYDNQMTRVYEQLQDAIDAYEANPTEENRKRYESLLQKYQGTVKKYEADNAISAYTSGVTNQKDMQAYVAKASADLMNTPSFKVQATIYRGKKYVKSLVQKLFR